MAKGWRQQFSVCVGPAVSGSGGALAPPSELRRRDAEPDEVVNRPRVIAGDPFAREIGSRAPSDSMARRLQAHRGRKHDAGGEMIIRGPDSQRPITEEIDCHQPIAVAPVGAG